jgi:hypothetical protein
MHGMTSSAGTDAPHAGSFEIRPRAGSGDKNREPNDPSLLGFLQSAYARIVGRTAYEPSQPG